MFVVIVMRRAGLLRVTIQNGGGSFPPIFFKYCLEECPLLLVPLSSSVVRHCADMVICLPDVPLLVLSIQPPISLSSSLLGFNCAYIWTHGLVIYLMDGCMCMHVYAGSGMHPPAQIDTFVGALIDREGP
eukprot:GHVU01034917.1.p1 GENE.GHVU01034917.1~~GHVU01034917.1.p1  ORF type:complete len:130 (+),score=4.74 GHVU01034917.1:42-431(+)